MQSIWFALSYLGKSQLKQKALQAYVAPATPKLSVTWDFLGVISDFHLTVAKPSKLKNRLKSYFPQLKAVSEVGFQVRVGSLLAKSAACLPLAASAPSQISWPQKGRI